MAGPRRRTYQLQDLAAHLDPGPTKRILALDGGGVRGAMAIAVLEKIETVLRRRHGNHPNFRLSDYFDLIGGTSTGAIIASGLAAKGFTASEIRDLYEDLVPRVFQQRGFMPSKGIFQTKIRRQTFAGYTGRYLRRHDPGR